MSLYDISTDAIIPDLRLQISPMPDLPLTETTFFILTSLVAGPRHGYAILKDVQALSEQRILLSTGTLYGALKRLLEQGWIIRLDNEIEPPSSRRVRKLYTLTPAGRRILEAELDRLQHLLHLARQRARPAAASSPE
jgi:DNA-binding PadR family transcriptional regulator